MKGHYTEVIMGTMASQITSLTTVYSTIYSGADQRKHQSSTSLAFVRGIHQGLVNSPHKWPVTRKMIPFDDIIMDISLPLSIIMINVVYNPYYQNFNPYLPLYVFHCYILPESEANGTQQFWVEFYDSTANTHLAVFTPSFQHNA